MSPPDDFDDDDEELDPEFDDDSREPCDLYRDCYFKLGLEDEDRDDWPR